MIKNHKLAKNIADCGWSMFTTMLEYKTNWFGKNIIKIGRFKPSSKLCSTCGYHNIELNLSDRTCLCPQCNTSLDIDINASINIKELGLVKELGDKCKILLIY